MQNLKIVLTIALSINLAFSNLFFSEAAEGSSNNKYLEVFNASDADIDLTNYAFPSVSNDPTEVGVYEYWNAFSEGATVAAGDVYVICHPSADDLIQTECDETFTYLSNGDDGFCLVNGNENEYSIVDCVGDWNADPGSGWDVCGISDGTKDHTIVRKSSVSVGNSGDWTASAGTNTDDCEWLVFEQNDWTNLGSHSFDANNEPDHIVYVGPYMTYTPQDLSIETGETVQWIMEGGFHDVNGVTNTITGESFNNPEEFYFDATSDLGVMGEFTFTIPGLYNYDCSVGNHAAMGMIGSINVAQGAILGCMDPNATNYNSDATEQDYDGNGTSSCTYDSCEDIPTETGCLWDTGQSAEWWEGWWNCTENGGQVCGLAEVIFEVDLPDGVEGVPHVQGTYNGWCGSCFNDMTDEDGDGIWSHTQYFSAGEYHDYKYSIGAWVEQEDLTGLDCAAEADGFWNRNFTAGEANTSQTLAHCYGSCETTCGDTPPPPTSYDVTFDLDGIDDCGFVSVTGSWDGFTGWGATPDNNYTISLQDGSYEYVILCVNTEGEWWNDIWSNSTIFNAPLECDVTVDVEDGPFGNYGLTVAGENQTVSLCAGTCDTQCVTYPVTLSVDMSFENVSDDGVSVYGLFSWSDGILMDDSDNDGIYSVSVSLGSGDYLYKFKNGNSWEDVDELSCSVFDDPDGDGFGYWDRSLSVVDSELSIATDCFGACGDCIGGCTDQNALNYDENANTDDGSCEFEEVQAANLFFSEYAEGSSNNKYLEIYNGSEVDVDLSGYSLSSCSNGCNDGLSWDYPDNVTFENGTILLSGDVYIVCHGSADDIIQAECDQTFTYLSNGDDVFALTQIGSGNILDIIGTIGDDPGSGWDVAGISDATKDHTLVRKSTVESGNDGDWELSAGTDTDNSEWIVLDQNDWSYIGCHIITCQDETILGCLDPIATNYNPDATEQDYNEYGTSTCTYESCEDIPTETGCLYEDGTSAEWWEGWWNCTDAGGQVCGLAEVIFEVDLPDGVEGVPHVQGTYNGWCGSCFNDMTDEDGDGIWSHTQYFSAGEYHDYKYSIGAWVEQEDLTGLDCAAEADGFWNRNFTAGEANTSQTLAHCYGSCETTCGDTPPPPTSYDVTFDLDGIDDCGFVSVTGSWDGWSGWGATPDNNYTISLQDGSYEYVILCVNTEGEWWNDIWSNSTFFNAPLECDVTVDVEDGPFGNYGLTVAGENQTVSLCAGTCDETCGSGVVCGTGDSNQDSGVDVLDVVLVVDFVLGNNTPNDDQLCASDMNADGGIDVLDVVQIVDIILGNRGFKANTAEILINGSDVKFDANGIVDAFQIKLSHNGPIELELTDDALVSKYRTVGNTTTLIIVSPESDYLFTSDNHYIIEEALAATTDGYIDVTMDIPLDYTIGNAYPNPFNPTTNLSIDLNTNAKVNISIYNTMGQLMDVIVNDNLSSGYHTYVWDANDAPSGLYLIQTDVNSNISTQKVLLIK